MARAMLLSRRGRAAILLAVTAGAGLLALFIADSRATARLLRASPDVIAADPQLQHMAMRRGARVYRAHCQACHGHEGRGDPAPGAPNLADADWLYGAGQVEEVERVVSYGIRAHHPKGWRLADMPAFGHAVPSPGYRASPLGPQDLGDVTEYVYSLSHASADQAAAARGAVLFQGKGACFDCHATDAGGDVSIGAPNLTDRVWLYGDGGRTAIEASIAGGRQGVCPAWVGRLRATDIRAVAVYVSSSAHMPRSQ